MQIKTLIYNDQNHFSFRLINTGNMYLSYLLEQALASIHSLRQSPQIHENFEGGLEYSFHSFPRPHTGHLPDCLCFKIHTFPRQEGPNGVNRQPSNGQKNQLFLFLFFSSIFFIFLTFFFSNMSKIISFYSNLQLNLCFKFV